MRREAGDPPDPDALPSHLPRIVVTKRIGSGDPTITQKAQAGNARSQRRRGQGEQCRPDQGPLSELAPEDVGAMTGRRETRPT